MGKAIFKLTLSYRGTAYAGWQRQKNATAVQEVVEEALSTLLDDDVRIQGASRTDAGVHARGQVAHLEPPRDFPARGLVHGTARLLPPDIRILAAHRMSPGFHARKWALGKEYVYRVYRGAVVPPLDEPFAARVERPLDVRAIRRALEVLPGRHDFSAFALEGGSHRDPRRRVFSATVEEAGRELRFRLLGDGFLRGMVRSLVGTLLEVGEGKRPPSNLAELLRGRPRGEAGPTAPARGLVLESVFYPSEWRPLDGYAG